MRLLCRTWSSGDGADRRSSAALLLLEKFGSSSAVFLLARPGRPDASRAVVCGRFREAFLAKNAELFRSPKASQHSRSPRIACMGYSECSECSEWSASAVPRPVREGTWLLTPLLSKQVAGQECHRVTMSDIVDCTTLVLVWSGRPGASRSLVENIRNKRVSCNTRQLALASAEGHRGSLRARRADKVECTLTTSWPFCLCDLFWVRI